MQADDPVDDFDGSGSGDSDEEMDPIDCDEIKCQGGGVCETDLYGEGHCQCKLGTQGRYCEDCKYLNQFYFINQPPSHHMPYPRWYRDYYIGSGICRLGDGMKF